MNLPHSHLRLLGLSARRLHRRPTPLANVCGGVLNVSARSFSTSPPLAALPITSIPDNTRPPDPASPPKPPTPPNSALLLSCLSTGLVDSLTFAVSGVWCAFVTGTTVQLGMDLPALFSALLTQTHDLPGALAHFACTSSSQRLASLSGFLLGGFTGSRCPPAVTPARSSVIQAALLGSAAAVVLSHPGVDHLPYAHVVLGLVSTSMSLQAVLVQKLATPYATSVAWTSVWLSAVAPSSPTKRWKRFAGLAALMGGAGIGAVVMKLGNEGVKGEDEDEDKAGRIEMIHRMGWGLVAAAAVKAAVAGIFMRRGRGGHVQL